MANISQNVNIEMLEKLPDGTYKRKYPKTRADTGVTFDEHLAGSATQAHLAKNIGLEDTADNFVSTELEGAMSELFTNVSNGYRVNPETKELEFSYPDPNEEEPQEPVYQKPLSEEASQLRNDLDSAIIELTMAMFMQGGM